MAYRTIQKPTQRVAVLASVFAIHVFIFLLALLTGVARDQTPPPESGTLSVVSLTAEPAASTPPPPPTLPSRIAETNLPLTETLPAAETDSQSSTAASGGCKTFEAVSTALLTDPAAMAAVLASPPETRSIADAIVLWNTGWSAAAPMVEGPLSAVRLRVETSLRSVEPACLDEEVAGPRLIPVPTGDRTTFIVIGSGKWLWGDLLSSDKRLAPDPRISTVPAVAPSQSS